MARPTTLRGSKLLIKLGDGASPEAFTAPCALSTKAFNRSAGVNEFNVGDCDDPDAPIWTERVKSALSSTVSGSGTLAKESLAAYEAFFVEPDPGNVQITVDWVGDPVTYQGAYVMTAFNITGEQDGLIQVEIELQSSGEVAEVA
ncbi:MAG: phage tail tube protein [Albidovulum sp.]